MSTTRTALASVALAAAAFIVTAAASVAHAYSPFYLVRTEPSNGGVVCVYTNGTHFIRQFRPYSAGYCPYNPD